MSGIMLRHRLLLFLCLWSPLSLASVGLALFGAPAPVQAQVEKVEELRYPPLPELVIPEPHRIVLDNGMVVPVGTSRKNRVGFLNGNGASHGRHQKPERR